LVVSVLMATSDSLGVDFEPRLRDSMSYVLMVPLGFGIAFQLPLAMLALNRFGVIPIAFYTQHWRVALLAIAFVSMLLTPPDATTMMAMFVPLTLLYFSGILLCKVMPFGYGLGSQKRNCPV
jgi:sec-independent protein translocase protein TatC